MDEVIIMGLMVIPLTLIGMCIWFFGSVYADIEQQKDNQNTIEQACTQLGGITLQKTNDCIFNNETLHGRLGTNDKVLFFDKDDKLINTVIKNNGGVK